MIGNNFAVQTYQIKPATKKNKEPAICEISDKNKSEPETPNKNNKALVSFQGLGKFSLFVRKKAEESVNGLAIPSGNIYGQGKSKVLQSLKNINFYNLPSVKEGLNRLGELKNNKNAFSEFDSVSELMLNVSEDFAKKVENILSLKNRKLVKIINNGSNSIVFQLDKNPLTQEEEILKISYKPNHPEVLGRNFEPSFDIPVLEKGKVRSDANKTIYYCIHPKASGEGINDSHVNEVVDQIQKTGHEIQDMNPDQVMIYNGKPCLVDPECAKINLNSPGNEDNFWQELYY